MDNLDPNIELAANLARDRAVADATARGLTEDEIRVAGESAREAIITAANERMQALEQERVRAEEQRRREDEVRRQEEINLAQDNSNGRGEPLEPNVIINDKKPARSKSLDGRPNDQLEAYFFRTRKVENDPKGVREAPPPAYPDEEFVVGMGDKKVAYKDKLTYVLAHLALRAKEMDNSKNPPDNIDFGSCPMDSLEEIVNDSVKRNVRQVLTQQDTEDSWEKIPPPRYGNVATLASCEKELKSTLQIGKNYYGDEKDRNMPLQQIMEAIRGIVEKYGLNENATMELLMKCLKGKPRSLVWIQWTKGGAAANSIWDAVQGFAKPQMSMAEAERELTKLANSSASLPSIYASMNEICFDAVAHLPKEDQRNTAARMCQEYLHKYVLKNYGAITSNQIRKEERNVRQYMSLSGPVIPVDGLNALYKICLTSLQGQDPIRSSRNVSSIDAGDDRDSVGGAVMAVGPVQPTNKPQNKAKGGNRSNDSERRDNSSRGSRGRENNNNRFNQRGQVHSTNGGRSQRNWGNNQRGSNSNNQNNRYNDSRSQNRGQTYSNNSQRNYPPRQPTNQGSRPQQGSPPNNQKCFLCSSTGGQPTLSNGNRNQNYHTSYRNCPFYPRERFDLNRPCNNCGGGHMTRCRKPTRQVPTGFQATEAYQLNPPPQAAPQHQQPQNPGQVNSIQSVLSEHESDF